VLVPKNALRTKSLPEVSGNNVHDNVVLKGSFLLNMVCNSALPSSIDSKRQLVSDIVLDE